MAYKVPTELADDLLREARKNTLNKRINYKGNYENYINGGSHALNNQASIWDRNNPEYLLSLNDPNSPGWSDEEWMKELNDRYTNPQHNEKAGNSPIGSGLKYIHRYTPSTRRGRRASDIWFRAGRDGAPERKETLEQIQEIVNKYEGRK